VSRGWTLPAAAAAFWGGLLLWTVAPAWAQPWMGLALGVSALSGAALLSPPIAVGQRPLERLGLTAADPAPVRAVAAPRVAPAAKSAPPVAAALLVLGLVGLASGWGGVHELRLDTSLLARIAPAGIEAQGSFRTDPSGGGYGWSAVVDLSSVVAGGRA
jgi:hypothetical protein